jgi:hypothetical protein
LASGELVARIILKMVALVEGTLEGWVNVANVSGNITPSLSPFGEAFSGSMSHLVEATTRLMATIMSYLG